MTNLGSHSSPDPMKMTARSLFCMLAASILLAGPASAQFIVFQARELGIDPDPGSRNVRLLAMGGMRFVIPDENNEINFSDFGGNVAGVAADKDGWSVESTMARKRQTDDRIAVRSGSEFSQRQAVTSEVVEFEAIYRSPEGRAVGGSFSWTALGSDFRFGDEGRVRGPSFSALWNESVGDLRLGLAVQRITDTEALVTSNIFGLTHESASWHTGIGLIYPYMGIEWGTLFQYNQTRIDGTSRDDSGFHQDDFRWLRPERFVRFSAMLPEGGDLEFGVNLTRSDVDGAEEGQISWSDRFPDNPGGFDFDVFVPTFDEEVNGTRFEARGLYWLGYAPRVSAFFAYEDRETVITESPNFIGSRRAGTEDLRRTEIGGGFATSFFGDRVTVGVEGELITSESDLGDRAGMVRSVSGRDGAGRIGLEWFTRQDFVLRGGYEFLSTDPDTDAPFTLQEGQSASVGFGWVPRGGIYVVDGMFRYVDREPKDQGGASREVDSFELGLFWRLLF